MNDNSKQLVDDFNSNETHNKFEPNQAQNSKNKVMIDNELISSLWTHYLKDRKSMIFWRRFWRFLWLLLIIVFAYFSFFNTPSTNYQHTALINIKGEIADNALANHSSINRSLQEAFEDPNSKAVVLRFNSPGGSPVHANIVYNEIKRLKAKYKKPIYSVVEESCASAAYYIAVATDKIYLDPSSIIGSIGVILEGNDLSGLIQKVGVQRRLFTAGEDKAFLDMFKPIEKQHEVYIKSILHQVHEQFISVVKKERAKKLNSKYDLFTGMFWVGKTAIDLGIADAIGDLNYVSRDLIKCPQLVDYSETENPLDKVVKRFSTSLLADVFNYFAKSLKFN